MLGDIDRQLILHGLRNGFDITDKDFNPFPVQCDNHISARPGSPLYDKTTKQIMGNYELVSDPSDIISPTAPCQKDKQLMTI